jgi:hypothetical protein
VNAIFAAGQRKQSDPFCNRQRPQLARSRWQQILAIPYKKKAVDFYQQSFSI